MPIEAHEANRRNWDQSALYWKQLRDRDQLWRRCPTEPEVAFAGRALEMIRATLGDLAGREVCVIGSGDNYAAFALAGLGARVTSTDISQRQLDVARERSRELGLEIRFVRTDAADLAPLGDGRFDLVCSTNGFFVWIAELDRVFRSVKRVLKPGGYYIFYDIHPFQRPWGDNRQKSVMVQSYWEVGPHTNPDGATYEFAWTLADLLNPLVGSGLLLKEIAESPADSARFWEDYSYEAATDESLNDWRRNPRAGLPVWLTVCAQHSGRLCESPRTLTESP